MNQPKAIQLFSVMATPGVQAIADERRRQIEDEGWDQTHDDQHTDESLALVAALYAAPFPVFSLEEDAFDDGTRWLSFTDPWPASWDEGWDKRMDHDQRRRLVIEGELIAAEIERLDRALLEKAH
jgi:hypothetical protein